MYPERTPALKRVYAALMLSSQSLVSSSALARCAATIAWACCWAATSAARAFAIASPCALASANHWAIPLLGYRVLSSAPRFCFASARKRSAFCFRFPRA